MLAARTKPRRDKGTKADNSKPSARQFSILDSVRLIGFSAQSAVPIDFVILVVALEPYDLAVPFEREDMRRDAIEEPAIVADDDGAATE
jgi:hypothetical protein